MSPSLKLLSSAQNDTVKQLARLMQHGRECRRQGVMVLEGIHLSQSCLQAGWSLEQVFVHPRASLCGEVRELLQALPDHARAYELDAGLFSRLSALNSAPEILAVCRRPTLLGAHPHASRLLLEDIRDPGNMGTILRSAAASGLTQVFLSPGCVDVYSAKVLRAGMGAHFALDLHENIELLAELQAFSGIKLVTSLEGDRSLYAQDLTPPVAFVFGNEGAGVSAALHDAADARVRIPMPGRAESLNVAMAATLCLFERVRQIEQAG
jgi:TrmH family RNA methyltransferase